MQFEFVSKHTISQRFKLSPETLKKYRLNGRLIEKIHWIKLNSRVVLYNLQLVQDWFQNQGDPQAHQRAIENYQATLLSNQKRKTKHGFSSEKTN